MKDAILAIIVFTVLIASRETYNYIYQAGWDQGYIASEMDQRISPPIIVDTEYSVVTATTTKWEDDHGPDSDTQPHYGIASRIDATR